MSTDAEVAYRRRPTDRPPQPGRAGARRQLVRGHLHGQRLPLARLPARHAGLRYVDLVLLAGMEPRGGMCPHHGLPPQPPQRRAGVPDEVEAQVEQEERHRAGWQRPAPSNTSARAGTAPASRVTRQYFSLR